MHRYLDTETTRGLAQGSMDRRWFFISRARLLIEEFVEY